MSGLDGKGSAYPNGVNVPKNKLFIADVAVTKTAAQINDLATKTGAETLTNKTLNLTMPVTAYTATGAIALPAGVASMNTTAGAMAMTLANPGAAGVMLVITLAVRGGSNNAVVTTATAAGFDGTNNTATFDAAAETLVLISITATRWAIVENIGSVGLSAV